MMLARFGFMNLDQRARVGLLVTRSTIAMLRDFIPPRSAAPPRAGGQLSSDRAEMAMARAEAGLDLPCRGGLASAPRRRRKETGMIDRIRDGRTDLVFEHVGAGGAATARAGTASLIQWCAYYGDVSAIRFLLANGEELASLGGNLGLEGAAFHGHWRLCEYLVEAGADANHRRADNGETVLHAALSSAGRPSQKLVVDVLLAA